MARLRNGADPNEETREGWRLLHFVARAENAEMVKALLEFGADPDPQNRQGWTPLMISIRNESFEIAELLMPFADLGKKTKTGLGVEDFVRNLLWLGNQSKFESLLAAELAKLEKASLANAVPAAKGPGDRPSRM